MGWRPRFKKPLVIPVPRGVSIPRLTADEIGWLQQREMVRREFGEEAAKRFEEDSIRKAEKGE